MYECKLAFYLIGIFSHGNKWELILRNPASYHISCECFRYVFSLTFTLVAVYYALLHIHCVQISRSAECRNRGCVQLYCCVACLCVCVAEVKRQIYEWICVISGLCSGYVINHLHFSLSGGIVHWPQTHNLCCYIHWTWNEHHSLGRIGFVFVTYFHMAVPSSVIYWLHFTLFRKVCLVFNLQI